MTASGRFPKDLLVPRLFVERWKHPQATRSPSLIGRSAWRVLCRISSECAEVNARYGVRFAFCARYNTCMTADDIKRAYDEAAQGVLLEHQEAVAQILGEEQKKKEEADIAAVRARLIEHLP